MTEVHVGVVVGTRLPGNVRTFLENVIELLAGGGIDIRMDLLLRRGAGEAVFDTKQSERGDETIGEFGELQGNGRNSPIVEIVDPGIENTDSARDTLRTLLRSVTAYARDVGPDLLWQVTKFPLHGFATTVAGRRADVPVLTRFAGDNFREYTLSETRVERTRTFLLNNGLGRIAAQFSDATIVLGPYGREEIVSRGGDDVREIPQPVDRDQFSPAPPDRVSAIRSELGLSDTDRLLLTVGRLSKRKGTTNLIDAAVDLDRRGADYTWCVVGDGPLQSRVATLPNVRAVGRVPHDQIAPYYQAADLVVHPSLIEGLPNVLLEAAACGTPTLARNVGDAAVAASATYNDPTRLPALLDRSYEPVTLDGRFDPDRLREQYVSALVETAEGNR